MYGPVLNSQTASKTRSTLIPMTLCHWSISFQWVVYTSFVCCLLHYADDCQQLNKTCSSLINFEVTRDDLLKQGESEVDSTTEDTYSPIKKKAKLDRPKIKTKKTRKPAGSKSATQVKKVEAQAKLEAAKMRAREIFKAKHRLVPLLDSDSEEEQMGIHKQLQEQQQLIERLRKQLQERGKYVHTLYQS